MQMRSTSLPFILLGTLFTAGGYGGTFLISVWFRAQGGSDIDTGNALSMALVGTLIGVPLVGWCAGRIDAARLAAVAALVLAAGYVLLGNLPGLNPDYLPRMATLLMGLGWGMFYLAAPLALSERLTDAERGSGFTLFSAFQIAAGMLTGAGYGLLYPVIQTWAVNDSAPPDRHAALTWFVVSYFIGIFGFPVFGGWLLVTAGKNAFVWSLVLLALLELVVAVVRKPRPGRMLTLSD